MYSSNASDMVFNYIVSKLKKGEYEPGTRIETEEKLCEALNVSRIAVRQAIEKLNALQVLRKVQGSGTYVCRFEESSLAGMTCYQPNYERLLFILEFRQQFDAGNVELFARNASDEEKEKLYENYRLMCDAVTEKEEFQRLEREFHMIISRGTHNAIVIEIAKMMNDLLESFAELQYSNVGPENCIRWHGRVIEALENNDTEMARLCITTDLGNSIKSVEKHLSEE